MPPYNGFTAPLADNAYVGTTRQAALASGDVSTQTVLGRSLSAILSSASLAGHLDTIFETPRWKLALTNVLAGVSSATLLGIGDSTMFGVGYGTPAGASTIPNTIAAREWTYIAKLSAYLTSLGVPTSTDSFIGSGVSNYVVADLTAYNSQLVIDATWAFGGTSSLGGNTFRKASATAGPITFTPFNKSTHLELYIINNLGSWTVKCDGTIVLSYVTNATPDTVIKLVTPVQAEGYHVWTIEANSGAVSNMVGAIARNSVHPRVDIINTGFRGTTIVQTGNAGVYQALAAISVINPDLSIYTLGINDVRNGGNNTSVADITNYTKVIITTCRSTGDVILAPPHNISPSIEAGTGASMTDLLTMYNTLSVSLSLNLYKQASVVGAYNLGNAKNQYLDTLHLQDRSAADTIGNQLAQVVLAAANV